MTVLFKLTVSIQILPNDNLSVKHFLIQIESTFSLAQIIDNQFT